MEASEAFAAVQEGKQDLETFLQKDYHQMPNPISGDIALHTAAATGDAEMVKALLPYSPAWLLNVEGNSPLDVAANEDIKAIFSHYEAVKKNPESNELMNLFTANYVSPRKILYCDSLPLEAAKYEKKDSAAIETITKRLFRDSIKYPVALDRAPHDFDLQRLKEAYHCIKKRHNSIGLINMDRWGYAAFTSQKIPAHVIVDFYAGLLAYPDGSDISCIDTANGLFISIENFANMSAFFLYLPNKEKLENCYTLKNDHIKNTVQLSNLSCEWVGGLPIFKTKRVIQRNELLGFDYGAQVGVNIRLFDQSGKVIHPDLYSLKRIWIRAKDCVIDIVSVLKGRPFVAFSLRVLEAFFRSQEAQDKENLVREDDLKALYDLFCLQRADQSIREHDEFQEKFVSAMSLNILLLVTFLKDSVCLLQKLKTFLLENLDQDMPIIQRSTTPNMISAVLKTVNRSLKEKRPFVSAKIIGNRDILWTQVESEEIRHQLQEDFSQEEQDAWFPALSR